MNEKEFVAQIALGTLITAPAEIAKIVKKSDAPRIVRWASLHNSAKVRAAAAGNSSLPLIDFVRMRLFDNSSGVQQILHKNLEDREDDILELFAFLADYPQFRLPFIDEKLPTEYHKGSIKESV